MKNPKLARIVLSLAIGAQLWCAALAAHEDPLYYDDLVSSPSGRAGELRGGAVIEREGKRYYVYDGSGRFGEIAERVYGDDALWNLLYSANRQRLRPGSREGREGDFLLLELPEPPERRVETRGGRRTVTVYPGDSFTTLSLRLYGTRAHWRALYLANREKIPDPGNPFRLFGSSTRPMTFELPEGLELELYNRTARSDFGRDSTDAMPRAPGSSADTVSPYLDSLVQAERRKAAAEETPGSGTQATDPAGAGSLDLSRPEEGSYRRTSNPIAGLDVKSASEIGATEARLILSGIGMVKASEPISKGLQRLHRGYTYSAGGGSLDRTARERLFREYKLLRSALDKWGRFPEISSKATPHLVDSWIRSATSRLTSVPARDRYNVLRSLIVQETGVTHWKQHKPIVGGSGDTGFGQFLPATAKTMGINPYDPEENIRGIAMYLQDLIEDKGSLKEALASYNGGNRPPPQSYRYASAIISRANASAYA